MNVHNVGGSNILVSELRDERFKTSEMMIDDNRDCGKETYQENENLPRVIVTYYIAFMRPPFFGGPND